VRKCRWKGFKEQYGSLKASAARHFPDREFLGASDPEQKCVCVVRQVDVSPQSAGSAITI